MSQDTTIHLRRLWRALIDTANDPARTYMDLIKSEDFGINASTWVPVTGQFKVDCLEIFQGATPLALAVLCNKESLAKELVAEGADVLKRLVLRCPLSMSGNNHTLLHIAAHHGNVNLISFLIERGCDPNAIDSVGVTPLHLAALMNQAPAINKLVQCGANLTATEPFSGQTPLHYAASLGCVEAACALMDACCDYAVLNVRDASGQTPLYVAAFIGHADTIAAVVRKGGDPNIASSDGHTPLGQLASSWEDADDRLEAKKAACARGLLAGGANVSHLEHGSSLLQLAVDYSWRGIAQALIDYGIDMHGQECLMGAVALGQREAIPISRVLLDAGCDTEINGCPPSTISSDLSRCLDSEGVCFSKQLLPNLH